ncbi:MAG TPA: hypothetical protein VFF49_11285 [Thermodesulfobacteriota bacterium]|nr:hypothetical protein [Thermodesulfobacteriota bacterium]
MTVENGVNILAVRTDRKGQKRGIQVVMPLDEVTQYMMEIQEANSLGETSVAEVKYRDFDGGEQEFVAEDVFGEISYYGLHGPLMGKYVDVT